MLSKQIINFLIVGLTFAVLNVATVAAQADIPTADDSAAPINEGRDMDVGSHRAAPIGDAEESGGPAGQHMNREINDGGFGANSGADAEKARIAAEAQAAEEAEAQAAAEAAEDTLLLGPAE